VLASPGGVAAQESPVLVSAEWVGQRLADLVVVNIHTKDAGFEEDHIPGAQFVAWSDFVSNEAPGGEMRAPDEMAKIFAAAGVSLDRPAVFYGGQIPAARAFLAVEYLGHEKAHVLDGDLVAWRDAGYETESGPAAAVDPGDFIPRVRKDLLVDSDWVMANLETPAVTFIDARPDDEYRGEGDYGAARGMKPGHIPGANQVFFRELIRSQDDPRFLDLGALVARFEQANAKEGDTLVSYCMVGMRASVTYMISRHLGFDAEFYDGSWTDWSAKDLPVVEGAEPGGSR